MFLFVIKEDVIMRMVFSSGEWNGYFVFELLEKRKINDDDHDDEDRRACQSQWSRIVRPWQESKDPFYENVSLCVDRVEVDSHASCITKSTFAQLADFGPRGTGIYNRLSVH